ncbi:MAG TPA: carbohydrate-binding protein [Tepidisphaeraceae bacterium]|jgi:N-acetylneuraminic acid mutarotase|nr:carbohydrate-binding protein [Tepidisphaeraceae bacterium]
MPSLTTKSRKTRSNHFFAPEPLESRQLLTAAVASSPYSGAAIVAGQTIEAENFDLGGAGAGFQVAHPDTTPSANPYRAETAVEIDAGDSNGPTTGYHVANLAAGDWLQYTVNVPVAGNYVVDVRFSSPNVAGASVHFTFDGTLSTASVATGKTPAWTSWHTAESKAVALTAGVHVLRMTVDHNVTGLKVAANLDWFNLTAVGADPTTFNWKAAAPSPVGTYEQEAAMVNGLLYTFGGLTTIKDGGVSDTYQVYNPATNVWKSLGMMPGPQTHAEVAVDQSTGIIYLVGGFEGTIQGQIIVDNVYAYDTTANTWSQLPPLPVTVGAGDAAIVDGELHYFGGNQGQDRVTDHGDHWALDLSQVAAGTATWQTKAPLPDPRVHSSAIAYNGLIYTFAGETGHEVYHRQQTGNYAYDPSTDTWTTLAPIPIPLSHDEDSTFVHDGMLVIAGGQIDDSDSTNIIQEYDPATDRWFLLQATLPGILQGAVVAPWNNELILANGYPANDVAGVKNVWIGQWPDATPVIPPVTPAAEAPFLAAPFVVGQTIEAENYDTGGEGVAYHDTTPTNLGAAAYRPTDAVDVQAGGSNGYDVGYAVSGEWLNYTINVTTAGSYELQASVANTAKGGTFHADLGNGIATSTLSVPNTGNWQKYQTVTSSPVTLAPGTYVMRIDLDANASSKAVGNFDWFELIPAPIVTPPMILPPPVTGAPFSGTPFNVGQTIETEDYNSGGEGLAYHDTTPANLGGAGYRPGDAVDIQVGGSNGYHVGYTAAGEWLTYTVNIATAGAYELQSSVDNAGTGAAFHADFGNGVKTASIAVPNTGDWTSLQTVTSGKVTLPAGTFVMKILMDKNSSKGAVGNFDWFSLIPAPGASPVK